MFSNILLACGAAAQNAAVAGNGCYDWPVIKQIIWVFGFVMEYIFKFFDLIGIGNVGLVIIVFTLIIKFVLLPLTIKQQKFSKLSSIMQPELQAVQAKYKGKNDQYSMQQMQAETKEIYAKYGVSQAGGCLQTFIQMPILIAMYGALRELPTFVNILKTPLEKVVEVLQGVGPQAYETIAKGLGNLDSVTPVANQITTLYNFSHAQWDQLAAASGSQAGLINDLHMQMMNANRFLGFDISQSPLNLIRGGGIGIVAIILPLIAGFAQWLSFKLTQTKQSAQQRDASAATMNSMGFVMPLFSVFICLTLNSGLGLYWAFSSLFQVVLQIFINKHYRKIDMDEFVKENMKKAEEKAEKKKAKQKDRASASSILQGANTNTKNIASQAPSTLAQKANMNVGDAPVNNQPINPNSLAAKAGMVAQFNKENGIEVSDETNNKAHRKYKK